MTALLSSGWQLGKQALVYVTELLCLIDATATQRELSPCLCFVPAALLLWAALRALG